MFVYALSAHDWLIAQLRNFWDCRIPAHTLILSHCSMHPSRIWNRDKRFGSVLSGDELSRTIRNHFGTISVRLKPFKNHLEPLWSVQEPFETISVRQEPSSTKQFHTLHPPQHRNYSILLRFCVLASFLFMFFFCVFVSILDEKKKMEKRRFIINGFFPFYQHNRLNSTRRCWNGPSSWSSLLCLYMFSSTCVDLCNEFFGV